MPALSVPLQVASLVEASSAVKRLAKVAIAAVASCIILASDSVVPIEERKEPKLMMAAKELYHSTTDKVLRWLNPANGHLTGIARDLKDAHPEHGRTFSMSTCSKKVARTRR
ncbi:hypothetical protein F5146DRAFT_1005945 [Armillaria mellea]|nr:hypothetical protein F5146DRAFT_1005945 [Armillaria mellea]